MKKEIYIYDLQSRQIKDNHTGEVCDYINVCYITEQGCRNLALNCYVKARFLEILKKYYEKKVVAELDLKTTRDGTFKLRLISINNEKVR